MPSSKGWKGPRRGSGSGESSIGELVAGILRRPEFARGMPIATLTTSWQGVVGPRLGAVSAPMSLDGGLLVVAVTTGAWAAQAKFLAAEIRKKANETIGSEVVQQVQVVVRPDAVKPL